MSTTLQRSRNVIIRDFTLQDCAAVAQLISDLQAYENFPKSRITAESLARDSGLLPNQPFRYFRSLIADLNGEVVGYILYYFAYVSGAGKLLFMQDLFVKEAVRGTGAGKQLLRALAKLARDEKCEIRFEVLDWNKPSIDFYQHNGSRLLYKNDTVWEVHVFDFEAIEKLARE